MNGGLEKYIGETLNALRKPGIEALAVRGEDVPILASEPKVIGITGFDLYSNFKKTPAQMQPKVPFRYLWTEARENMLGTLAEIEIQDPQAKYGKPALCFLIREGSTFPANPLVAVNRKYGYLAEDALEQLLLAGQIEGYRTAWLNGKTEIAGPRIGANLVIDVVNTGKTIEKTGYQVLGEPIMKSDLVVIGNLQGRWVK